MPEEPLPPESPTPSPLPALPDMDTIDKIVGRAALKDDRKNYSEKLAENEQRDRFEDHNRGVVYKRQLHAIVVIGMWVVGIILICLLCIRAWHLATPSCLQWLSGDQLHSIDAVLFSSVIFSLASKYFAYYKLFQQKSN